MEDPKELPDKIFSETYEWVFAVEHPSLEKQMNIIIYEDTYPAVKKKLIALNIPFELKFFHLIAVENYIPIQCTIKTEKTDEENNS